MSRKRTNLNNLSTYEPGIDYRGGDYMHHPDSDAAMCLDQCVSDSQCMGWTFNKENHECWLKDKQGHPRFNPNAVSGRLDSARKESNIEDHLDCRGGDFKSATYPSAAHCEVACINSDKPHNCVQWNYNPATNQCWLKDQHRSCKPAETGSAGWITPHTLDRKSIVEDNIDHKHGDYHSFVVSGTNECQDTCEGDPKCIRWVFNRNDKKCWLKDQYTPASHDPNAASGTIVNAYRTVS